MYFTRFSFFYGFSFEKINRIKSSSPNVEYKLNKHITQRFQKCKTKKISIKDDRNPKLTFHQNSRYPKYGVEPTNATKSHGLC
jgi:hypothetical protein